MPIHVVTQGECFASIVRKYGFSEWKTIYDAQDADFKEKRPNPNVIFPGDRIVVPDLKKKEAACPTDQTHKFKVKRPKTKLRVRFKDLAMQGISGTKYKLSVEGEEFEGTTNSDGILDHPVPSDARTAHLTIFSDDGPLMTLTLRLGDLDPESEVSGAQARLRHLGYDCGPIDGKLERLTEGALRTFQKKNELHTSGVLDDATRDKLRGLHDE